MNRHIQIDAKPPKDKPNTYRNQQASCPFCNQDKLIQDNHTLVQHKTHRWIKNKYPTLHNTYQTVIVETTDCLNQLETYSLQDLTSLLSFSIDCWLTLSQDPQYQSVLFFKNHGIHAGASLRHAHMQIIGLSTVDYRSLMTPSSFDGLPIYKDATVSWVLSTQPKNEFYEFSIHIAKQEVIKTLQTKTNTKAFERFCVCIQRTVQFVLETLCPRSQSYNLAFYDQGDQIVVKIIPRFFSQGVPFSALLVGYHISLVPTNLEEIQKRMQSMYLPIFPE